MTIRIILTRFAVSTFCIFYFFLKVPKNPLEKVYCYSNHTKPLISITAWIPVQGGFGEVCPSATAVMKALIDVSNLIFLCMYGCWKNATWLKLYIPCTKTFISSLANFLLQNGKGSSRGLRFFWRRGRISVMKLIGNIHMKKKVQI